MKSLAIIGVLLCCMTAKAQITKERPMRKEIGRFSILSGLHQPILLKGGNIAVNYVTKKNIYLEASFGIGLDYTALLSSEDEFKYSSVKSPFSYGFGIGYFWKGLSVALEPKATIFEITDNKGKEETYTTFSVGLGTYYNISLWKGFFLQPSLKYWPKVGSTLEGDGVEMQNITGEKFTHEARTPGNNGLIYGVSLGWNF